jgi:hypothetical protein
MYFRGFFSGGPSSNRGVPLRGVAPHGNFYLHLSCGAGARYDTHKLPTEGIQPTRFGVPLGVSIGVLESF